MHMTPRGSSISTVTRDAHYVRYLYDIWAGSGQLWHTIVNKLSSFRPAYLDVLVGGVATMLYQACC